MPVDTATIVRHPYAGEVPAELMIGFEAWTIDREWQWVVISEGKVVAQLLTANMHGMLYMLRITSLPTAPNGWAVKLFRHVMAEGKRLGLLGYMVMLTDDTKDQLRLMKIVQRQGAYIQPITGIFVAGRLENNY